MKTIYEHIKSVRTAKAAYKPNIDIPNIDNLTWQQADMLLASAIVNDGIRISSHIAHVRKIWHTHDVKSQDFILCVLNKYDKFKHNGLNSNTRIKSLLQRIYNYRQRTWNWEPFEINVDYSVYEQI